MMSWQAPLVLEFLAVYVLPYSHIHIPKDGNGVVRFTIQDINYWFHFWVLRSGRLPLIQCSLHLCSQCCTSLSHLDVACLPWPRGTSSPFRPAWRLSPLTTHPEVSFSCLMLSCGLQEERQVAIVEGPLAVLPCGGLAELLLRRPGITDLLGALLA